MKIFSESKCRIRIYDCRGRTRVTRELYTHTDRVKERGVRKLSKIKKNKKKINVKTEMYAHFNLDLPDN